MRFISELGALVAAYLLIATGVLSILFPAYYVWDLYIHPQSISVFADMFQASIIANTDSTSNETELFRLFAWPVVVFLLLMQNATSRQTLGARRKFFCCVHMQLKKCVVVVVVVVPLRAPA